MEITAKLSQYRQAPRKVRLVGNLIKGMPVTMALLELKNRSKRVAPVFHKLVLSAVANAKVKGLDAKDLRILNVRVDKGVVLKRSRPRAQGRAFPIHKHTSHVVVTLTDAPKGSKKKAPAPATSAPQNTPARATKRTVTKATSRAK